MTESDPSIPTGNMLPPTDVSQAIAPQPSLAYRFFLNPQGIRAGWRLLLYLLMVVGMALGLGFILQLSHVHRPRPLWVQVAQEGMLVVAAAVPALVMARIEKRHFGDYGLPGRQAFGKLFWIGCLWGLLAIMVLLVGFFEELLLRGYPQFTLTDAMGFWPAAAILSATFGGLHWGNSGEAWLGLISAALIGFFLCLTLRRTGNLWFAVGFHQA